MYSIVLSHGVTVTVFLLPFAHLNITCTLFYCFYFSLTRRYAFIGEIHFLNSVWQIVRFTGAIRRYIDQRHRPMQQSRNVDERDATSSTHANKSRLVTTRDVARQTRWYRQFLFHFYSPADEGEGRAIVTASGTIRHGQELGGVDLL